MAAGVKSWLLAVMLACALVAVAYLPLERSDGFFTAVRYRVSSISPQWWANPRGYRQATAILSNAHDFLAMLEARDSIRDAWGARASGPEQALEIRIQTELPSWVRDTITTLLEDVGPFVAVSKRLLAGAAIWVDTLARLDKLPVNVNSDELPVNLNSTETAYFMPNDGANVCLSAMILRKHAARQIAHRRASRHTFAEGSAISFLGPCAFYASFGRPGGHLRDWLEAVAYLPVSLPTWIADQPFLDPEIRHGLRARRSGSERLPVYDLIRLGTLVRCVHGEVDACRQAALGRDRFPPWFAAYAATRPAGVVTASRLRWMADPLGPGARAFFSDLLREMGRERFEQFWTSDLPVDSAFIDAFAIPIEDWTAQWARAEIGIPRRGPHAPLTSSLFAITLAGALVVVVVALATRRQVA